MERGAASRPVPHRWVRSLLRQPRHVVLAALVAGLLLGPHLPVAARWAAAALIGVASCAAASAGTVGKRVAITIVLAAAALALGAWIATARLRALDHTGLRPWVGHAVDLRAVVLTPPRARRFGRSVALARIGAGPGSGERVLIEAVGALPPGVGEEVRVRGGFRSLPAFEDSSRRAGAHALLRADSVVATGRRRPGLLGVVDGARERAERALDSGLPSSLAGLARGMVLGEDDRLDPAMRDDFRASGLAHLVAASGANVALLAAMALALGAAVGIPRTPRLIGALLLIAGYVPLAGGGPSIQRAGVMGVAALVAAIASQPASRWYALLLAAMVTLVINPRAVEDPGWQLSFLAVVALIVLVPPLRGRLARRMPRPPAEAIAVCLAAAAATAPLIALHFGRLSWVTVPANLLAAPAVAPVMWLGTLAAALGQLSPALASPFTAVAAWPLAFVAWTGHAAAALPGARAEAHLAPALAGAWWVGLALLAVGAVRERLATALRRGRSIIAARSPRRLAGILAAPAVVAVVVIAGAVRAPPAARSLVVSALDIGQGDATLIQDRGAAVLIDTGPPDSPILDRLRAAGVERLDVLVVTHVQLDHEGGAAAVLGAFPVGLVLDGRDGNPTPEGDRFASVARLRGVRLVRPQAGQRVRAGPIALDVLSPRVEPRALHAGQDPNQRAIVAELHDGSFSMLLTSDAESDVLLGLPLGSADVLKVSHHGSADPGLPELLRRVRPAIAIIEVGRHNPYGHPAPETVRELGDGPRVLRTDRDGTIRLRPRPGAIGIQAHA